MQQRFGLRAAPNVVMLIVVLLVFKGIVKSNYADLTFPGEPQLFLRKALFPAQPG